MCAQDNARARAASMASASTVRMLPTAFPGSPHTRRSRPRSSWRTRRHKSCVSPAPAAPPLLASLRATGSLSISHFAYLVAAGAGATRVDGGSSSAHPRRWALDLRHKPPRDRLPMSFFARVVPAPAALGGGLAPVSAEALDAPQLPHLAPNARAALVFVETSKLPVLPHELLSPQPDGGEPGSDVAASDVAGADAAASELLYWRLVSTDSCEALHTGALLTLRCLIGLRGLAVRDDDDGSPIVAFGMVNAVRLAPFVRHVMVPRHGCTVDGAATARGSAAPAPPQTAPRRRPRVRFAEAPREAAHGGAMHQLVWCRTAAGRELVLDFTGPQYGEDDRLAATGTPFWSARLPERRADEHTPVRVRGFEVTGQVALFSAPQLPEGVLENQMHAYIGSWIRDSALAVLDHRTGSAG